MDRSQLARKIFEVSYLKGDFTLRSGQKANEYFDKYRFEARPDLLKALGQHLSKLLNPQIEILAGLELGGVPLATALSLETSKPVIFVRKEAKTYGTCKIAEGMDFSGKRIAVIEDVITTGGQVKESIQILREQGAIIEQVLCVIQRAPENPFKSETFQFLSLFTMNELFESQAEPKK